MQDTNGPSRRVELAGANPIIIEVPADAAQALTEELDRLTEDWGRLTGEVAALKARMKSLQSERDEMQAALEKRLAEQVTPMTREEIDEIHRDGMTGEQFLAEVDRLFPASAEAR